MEAAGTLPENGTVILDQDGVRMELFDPYWVENELRFDVRVENNSGVNLDLEVERAEVNGVSVSSFGVYYMYAGETAYDYIVFLLDDSAASENIESLRFTAYAYDSYTGEPYFTADVTI